MPLNQITTADLAALVAAAKRIAVLTGAGMSQESGISTFRDAQNGLWERFDPARLATPAAWREDRALVYGWYRWRAAVISRAQPHAGHIALAALAKRAGNVTLITQNVDDLHERAGHADVIHLHGQLASLRCFACGRSGGRMQAADDSVEHPLLRVEPERCRHCAGDLRPAVVWFGESLPVEPWKRAEKAAGECDLFLVIGTSLAVRPAAHLPVLAAQSGATVVEINPSPSEHAEPKRMIVRSMAIAGCLALTRIAHSDT
jgi:NAD-dependent deacetylase